MGWMSDHVLDIRVWDVGHGSAAFLRAGKKNVVIDCGVNSEFSPIKWIRNEYGVTNLDYMIISHPHHDHIKDLDEVIEQDLKPSIISRPKKARGIIESKIEEEEEKEDGNDDYIEDAEIYLELDDYSSTPDPSPTEPEWVGIEQNSIFRADGGSDRGVTFHNYGVNDASVGPDDDWATINNLSKLTVVNAFGFRYVSAGDLLPDGIDELMSRDSVKDAIEDADVLVAPHHGREESFDEDFVEHINPDLVVFSDKGVDNTATADYWEIANGKTVDRNGSDEQTTRYVVTTRNDGRIRIEANNADDWQVSLSGKNYAEQTAASKAYQRIDFFN